MAVREAPAPLVLSSRSFFDLQSDFFESCRLISDPREIPSPQPQDSLRGAHPVHPSETPAEEENGALDTGVPASVGRLALSWTCHTCKMEFESLQDQRLHFKSDLHRLNIKLQISGKKVIDAEDFEEMGDASMSNDFDVSSISGSEEDPDNLSLPDFAKQKLYFRLQSGAIISLWKCLVLDDSEDISCENLNPNSIEYAKHAVNEDELIKRLNCLAHEPRDRTRLRTVLLTCGGHFAGCVFDGNTVVAHKTFHRYVVRGKAGKKQSAKDATGKAANSAGSSLRRYNEAALKKDIHDLLVSWKPYFDASSCNLVYAPSKNHNLLFDGIKLRSAVRHIPVTVRRPTFKEAQRIYRFLCHVADEQVEEKPVLEANPSAEEADRPREKRESRGLEEPEESFPLVETALHEAARSGDAQRTLELLEKGADPCERDSRGRTAYVLASEKEVRNTFRRFMALTPDKWDWRAAGVPSALTKEMEESQAAKQAEKDAKRKAKAKEARKLRKAKERARAEREAQRAAEESAAAAAVAAPGTTPLRSTGVARVVDEIPRTVVAADSPIAAGKVAAGGGGGGGGGGCYFCGASLAGLVPFHRFHYSYCSSSCLHSHRLAQQSS